MPGKGPTVKEHLTKQDRLTEGTRTQPTTFTAVKTLGSGVVADRPRHAGWVWLRIQS